MRFNNRVVWKCEEISLQNGAKIQRDGRQEKATKIPKASQAVIIFKWGDTEREKRKNRGKEIIKEIS